MSSMNNAKVSDSGYTNTYGNSQSQQSGSLLSHNSNRSQSSGYCGGHPSTFIFSNAALPQPISKKKSKDHNKKKPKTLTALSNDITPTSKGACKQTKARPHLVMYADRPDQKLKQSELTDGADPGEHNGDSIVTTPKEVLSCQNNSLNNISDNANKAGFGAIVSLHDGLVYSSASLETSLGYSKDAWTGRSFIDYIHPKDRSTFADKLIQNIILPFGRSEKDINRRQAKIFCHIRRYTGVEPNQNTDMDVINATNNYHTEKLKNNDNMCNDTVIYTPFRLNLGLKQYRERDSAEKLPIMFLIITAQPVLPAFNTPSEIVSSSIFSTCHTATGHLSHVDDDVVQYFGYLPQDMLGCSIFKYYHPTDLPFIKDIYEIVVRLDGSSYKSKPYRFSAQNGGYVILETEWSSFINPWEKKLEFIVGHHRVLRGPENPNVLLQSDSINCGLSSKINDALMEKSEIIQTEICTLLAEKISKSTNANALNLIKQSNGLTTFVESLIYEMKGAVKAFAKETQMKIIDDKSFSDQYSVMPNSHREYCDSESSSETPINYNQLNYNEKLERYFNSEPVLTGIYDSDTINVNLTTSSNDDMTKTSLNDTPSNHNTRNHDSGGSGSNENLSSGSNNQTSSTTRDDNAHCNSNFIVPDNLKLMTLTESLLNKHNQDAENSMIRKYQELRMSIKNSKLKKEIRIKANEQEQLKKKQEVMQCNGQGYKRTNSHNREKKSFKIAKYDNMMQNHNSGENTTGIDNKTINDNSVKKDSGPSINMWPQMTVPHPMHSTTQNKSQCPTLANILPIYYMPVPQIHENTINIKTPTQRSNQFPNLMPSAQPNTYAPYTPAPLTGIIYPSVFGAPAQPSIIYAPPVMLKMLTVQNNNTEKLEKVHPLKTMNDRKRPASQATSIKAERGSIVAMSESSKKFLSPCDHFSSCVNVDGGCSSSIDLPAPIDNTTRISHLASSQENSSDSSFYGSFLHTSSGSSWNQTLAPNMPERYTSRIHEDEMAERRRFSMVNELKANFEVQTARQVTSASQKMAQKNDGDTSLLQPQTMIDWPQQNQMLRMLPSCFQDINRTPEIIYRYQMSPKTLTEVLTADMNILETFHQPLLVNDQLDQLHLDLELQDFDKQLILGDSNQSDDKDDIGGYDISTNISPQVRSTCIIASDEK